MKNGTLKKKQNIITKKCDLRNSLFYQKLAFRNNRIRFYNMLKITLIDGSKSRSREWYFLTYMNCVARSAIKLFYQKEQKKKQESRNLFRENDRLGNSFTLKIALIDVGKRLIERMAVSKSLFS